MCRLRKVGRGYEIHFRWVQKLLQIKSYKMAHIETIISKRLKYRKRQDKANFFPDQSCSIIINGADHSVFCLPHFVSKTNGAWGRGLKVQLVGILKHGKPIFLHLFTMTEEF